MSETPLHQKTIMLAVGKELQENAEKEADATASYTELLIDLNGILIQESGNQDICEPVSALIKVIEELVGDELNHAKRLHEAYELFTKIPTAAD